MFGTLLAGLAMLSASFGLTMDAVAKKNLEKVSDRWPGAVRTKDYVLPPTRGEAFEQFDQKFVVEFVDRKVGSRNVVVQRIKGLNIGDPLTDNSHRPDG
jgi:hypothetical protein